VDHLDKSNAANHSPCLKYHFTSSAMPQKQESSDHMHIEAAAPLQSPIHDDLEEAKANSIYEVILLR
jgi:hypothetical protein